jgi:catechol 2,3-dioxygenase-like lactoylglutathione lyase family enzyme
MSIRFDHTIIPARDKQESARFFTEMFGLEAAHEDGFFLSVTLADGAHIDFAEPPVDFPPHHYAFLIDERDFDALLARIEQRGLPHWADPRMARTGINHNHGGRGVYFDDPSGHHLEAITQPYGADVR